MRSGFTLPEILIVIGLTALLVGLSSVLGSRSVSVQEFARIRETIRSELATAKADAAAGTRDSDWGVSVATGTITRFKGSSYASRNTAFDSLTTLPASITITSAATIVFTRPYGLPSATGTIVITGSGRTATTTVNAQGIIERN